VSQDPPGTLLTECFGRGDRVRARGRLTLSEEVPTKPEPDVQRKLRDLTLNFMKAEGSGTNGERAGVYAIDQNGAPASIGDTTAAGFRCGK
jgi:hypothetical protein